MMSVGIPEMVSCPARVILSEEQRRSLHSAICNCAQNTMLGMGRQPRALIVTGSFARNEASFQRQGEDWRVLGDAEFVLICEEHEQVSVETLKQLENEIEAGLMAKHIICQVSLSIAASSYLREMPPHIYGYELKHFGRVLLGDPRILHLIPQFEPTHLPAEDACR